MYPNACHPERSEGSVVVNPAGPGYFRVARQSTRENAPHAYTLLNSTTTRMFWDARGQAPYANCTCAVSTFDFLLRSPNENSCLGGTGTTVKDVLVIIKSLDSNYQDASRQLTDDQGRINVLELRPGVHKVIATTPYGLWETKIKEFLVADQSIDLTLMVQPTPTHGFGDIVTVGSSSAQAQVLTTDGIPASGARLLVRDKDATLHRERWYKLDDKGKADIELVSSPTVLVIIHNGRICTTQIANTESHAVVRFSPD